MLLAIDSGNTNIVFAVFDGDNLLGKWRIATDRRKTSDEYGLLIIRFLELKNIAKEKITDIIIASVVPQAMFDLKKMCSDYFSVKPLVVGEIDVKVGVKTDLINKSEIGADRLVDVLAAYRKFGGDVIVIDFGTATTFNVVDSSANYLGGVICPGINLSLQALHLEAAKLPQVAVEKPKKVVASSTIEAMQSGIYFGYIGLIEGIVSRIKTELGKNMKVVATGGLADLFAKATNVIDHSEPDLTIFGLKEMFLLNS